jgi:prophage regulatory protein
VRLQRLLVWSHKPSETASRSQRGHARTRSYRPLENRCCQDRAVATIYRKIAEGTFPTQIKISINGTGWHESDINRWIADPVGWRPKREFDEVR